MERAQQEEGRLQVAYDNLSGGGALGELLAQQAMHLQERDAELQKSWAERDRARYALVRATGSDIFLPDTPAVHHGIWTPGRSYIFGEHCYDEDGRCYQAPQHGVIAGRGPGVTEFWVRCADDGTCPSPAPLPRGPHPADCGRAMRQDVFWWDADGTKNELADLSEERLHAVIGWLHEEAPRLWFDEFDAGTVLVPCPAHAYLSPGDWLADTPLMRALEAEAARCRPEADKSATDVAAKTARKQPRRERDVS
jgi:hypothetical protein